MTVSGVSIMPEQNDLKNVKRRGFFATFGLGGAAAVAAAAVSVVAPEPAEAMTPSGTKGGSHYRESEHIKQYYKVNRY